MKQLMFFLPVSYYQVTVNELHNIIIRFGSTCTTSDQPQDFPPFNKSYNFLPLDIAFRICLLRLKLYLVFAKHCIQQIILCNHQYNQSAREHP